MAHLHNVSDKDTHFRVDPITREIRKDTSSKVFVAQYDHNSERFTFELPRYIEGHDMTLCDKVEVRYINTASNRSGKTVGFYPVVDVRRSPDDENLLIFSWLISGKATKYAGTLKFSLRFACTEEGETVYSWGSSKFEITVVEGLNDPAVETQPGEYSIYEGEYAITPNVWGSVLPTKDKILTDDISVRAIPYGEVSNATGGITVSIG